MNTKAFRYFELGGIKTTRVLPDRFEAGACVKKVTFPPSTVCTGKTTVTIQGKNFRYGKQSKVKFEAVCPHPAVPENTACTPLISYATPLNTSSTATQLVAVAPQMTLEKAIDLPVNISYAVDGQHFTDKTEAVVVGSYFRKFSPWFVDPLLGPIDGGTVITVRGTGYTDTGFIRCQMTSSWGEESVMPVPGSFQSDNLIQCTTRNHAYQDQTGAGLYIALDGESYTKQLYYRAFKFYNNPVPASFKPASDTIAGGLKITVTGTDFPFGTVWYGMVARCRFGQLIVNATAVSATSLTCKTPKYPQPEETELYITFNGQNWHPTPAKFKFVAMPICYTCRDRVGPAGFPVAGAGRADQPGWQHLALVSTCVLLAIGMRGGGA